MSKVEVTFHGTAHVLVLADGTELVRGETVEVEQSLIEHLGHRTDLEIGEPAESASLFAPVAQPENGDDD